MTTIETDALIIGAGSAGLTAAIYTSRSLLKTIVVEKMAVGGQIASTDDVENYPGFPEGIGGYDLMLKFEAQAKRFGTEIEYAEILSLEKQADGLIAAKSEEKAYVAKAVLIATGANPNKLGCPGEKELTGKGVSYCATCDGSFFRGCSVAVVGGGDTAVQEAIFLTKFASHVTIIHRRDELRASKILQQRARANPKISFVWDSVVVAATGKDKLEALSVKNIKTGSVTELTVDGVFVYVGITPNSLVVSHAADLNPNGYIVTDPQGATRTPGIFAAGDVRNKLLRQVATAVGDGATAAMAIDEYIETHFRG